MYLIVDCKWLRLILEREDLVHLWNDFDHGANDKHIIIILPSKVSIIIWLPHQHAKK